MGVSRMSVGAYPPTMAEIVNLNRTRKARTKAAQAVEAAANRVKHGRTRAEKAADRRADADRERLLDGVRRDGAPEKG